MGKPKVKPNYRRRLLRLPDLDHCKRQYSTALVRRPHAEYMSTPSTSSSPGTVPNLASPSTAIVVVRYQDSPVVHAKPLGAAGHAGNAEGEKARVDAQRSCIDRSQGVDL